MDKQSEQKKAKYSLETWQENGKWFCKFKGTSSPVKEGTNQREVIKEFLKEQMSGDNAHPELNKAVNKAFKNAIAKDEAKRTKVKKEKKVKEPKVKMSETQKMMDRLRKVLEKKEDTHFFWAHHKFVFKFTDNNLVEVNRNALRTQKTEMFDMLDNSIEVEIGNYLKNKIGQKEGSIYND